MDIKKILQTLDSSSKKTAEGSTDMRQFLTVVTEGKNPKTNRLSQAENIVYMNTPRQKAVDLNETPGLFKTYLKLVEEEDINQEDGLRTRLSEHLSEVKSTPAPKPRNFVAKNATTSGAGAHKDKKKAEKQGDVKHKKQAVPVDENLSPPDGATAPPPKGKDGKYPVIVAGPNKGIRWGDINPKTGQQAMGPTNPALAEPAKKRRPAEIMPKTPAPAPYPEENPGMIRRAVRSVGKYLDKMDQDRDDQLGIQRGNPGQYDEAVAGPKNCWPGHRKVGTKPGTGKNAGKRVNDCEKIKKESVNSRTTPVNEGDE